MCPGNEIGMKVRLEHIFDLCAPFCCQFDIRFRLAQRVDNGCFAIRFYIISRYRQGSSCIIALYT